MGRDETSRLRPTRRPWSSLRNLKCSSAGTTLIWYSSSSVVGPSPTPPSAPTPLLELEAIVTGERGGLPLFLFRRQIWAARRGDGPGLSGQRWNGAAGPRHPAVIYLVCFGDFHIAPSYSLDSACRVVAPIFKCEHEALCISISSKIVRKDLNKGSKMLLPPF